MNTIVVVLLLAAPLLAAEYTGKTQLKGISDVSRFDRQNSGISVYLKKDYYTIAMGYRGTMNTLFLEFDSSAIPLDANITSATLTFTGIKTEGRMTVYYWNDTLKYVNNSVNHVFWIDSNGSFHNYCFYVGEIFFNTKLAVDITSSLQDSRINQKRPRYTSLLESPDTTLKIPSFSVDPKMAVIDVEYTSDTPIPPTTPQPITTTTSTPITTETIAVTLAPTSSLPPVPIDRNANGGTQILVGSLGVITFVLFALL
jgi:hypothetical protein